jgi:HSP20 family protein
MAQTRSSERDPLRALERLQREINEVFNADYERGTRGLFDRAISPSVDILEADNEFMVYCDLPGVDSKDLDLSIANSVLTIKGEKKEPAQPEDRMVYRCETWTGPFQRTISLPSSIDPASIQASLTDGVLVVHLPKREELKPRHIDVAVK